MKIFRTKHSLKIITTVALVVGILIPVIFTNTFFFSQFANTFNDEHKNTITLNAKSLDYALSQYLEKYSLVFDVISDSEVWPEITAINDALTIEEVKTLYTNITLDQPVPIYQSFSDDYRALVRLITSYETNGPIKAIYIGTPKKYVFTNEIGAGNTVLYGYQGETFDCTQRPWYIGAVSMGNDIFWSTPYVDKDNETIVLSASKTILDQNNELIGVISMDIHIDDFTDKILQITTDNKYSRFILDKNGTYIFADNNDIGTNIDNLELISFLTTDDEFIEIDQTIYTKIQNTESNWYIIEAFSENQIRNDLRNLLGSVWIFGLILLGLIILISYFLSYTFLKPLNILTKHFRRIEGEKDISIELLNNNINRKNEYGLLFKSVENMQKSVKDYMDKVEYLSFFDQLTNIHNRSHFEKKLVELNNEKYLPLSIVMVDLNGLKLINDAFGHYAGDELLKTTSSVLKEIKRPNDVLSRWGGDEFTLLLPNTKLSTAKLLVERIKILARKTKFKYGNVSVATGVATKVDIHEDISKVFKLAEQLMYQEKNSVDSSIRSETINTIINTLFEKSPAIKDHSIRVSKLASQIAMAMDLPDNVVNDVKTIGTLHDIGKIVIDSSILDKSAPLSKEEKMIVENHSLIGSRMLSSTHEYTRLASGVLHHHERIDGTGYPNKLKGIQIPLESRIIAVAEAFDAMIYPRPYKGLKMTLEEVKVELITHSGTQFDQEVVDIFINKVLPTYFD